MSKSARIVDPDIMTVFDPHSAHKVIGRITSDGVVEVFDPALGELRAASWEEAVALHVEVGMRLKWDDGGTPVFPQGEPQ